MLLNEPRKVMSLSNLEGQLYEVGETREIAGWISQRDNTFVVAVEGADISISDSYIENLNIISSMIIFWNLEWVAQSRYDS